MLTDEEIDTLFKKIDTDNDGIFTYQNFYNFWKSIIK